MKKLRIVNKKKFREAIFSIISFIILVTLINLFLFDLLLHTHKYSTIERYQMSLHNESCPNCNYNPNE